LARVDKTYESFEVHSDDPICGDAGSVWTGPARSRQRCGRTVSTIRGGPRPATAGPRRAESPKLEVRRQASPPIGAQSLQSDWASAGGSRDSSAGQDGVSPPPEHRTDCGCSCRSSVAEVGEEHLALRHRAERRRIGGGASQGAAIIP